MLALKIGFLNELWVPRFAVGVIFENSPARYPYPCLIIGSEMPGLIRQPASGEDQQAGMPDAEASEYAFIRKTVVPFLGDYQVVEYLNIHDFPCLFQLPGDLVVCIRGQQVPGGMVVA